MKVNIGEYTDCGEKQEVDVQIDEWDTWSLDSTLALIIAPALKRLHEMSMSYFCPDLEDVPEELRHAEVKDTGEGDSYSMIEAPSLARYHWVMDEMQYAFDSIVEDRDLNYFDENNNMDKVGLAAHEARVKNGLRLFGKYYQSLWS